MIDDRKALNHIEFLQLLKLTGDFYGQPFNLLPWQYDVIHDVYGTVDATGLRQYAYAYLEVPKKNGKTEMIAGIALDHLCTDPPSGQIYCCAAEREQAGLVYRAAKEKIEQDKSLSLILNVVDSKKEIHNTLTGTFIKVLSAEAYSKHGVNPTVIIFDELHALQKRDLWDTMIFGSGAARKEQLVWVITTAGDDPNRRSIGWEKHEYARKVRDGELIDPTWYVKIYGAPEDANIFDEKVWYEANPSLGTTIDIKKVRQEALQAHNSDGDERLFRWLRLNQWIALKRTGWLPITLWDSTVGLWTRADMLHRACYIGLDLSTTTDLTSLAVLFPPSGDATDWRFFYESFIPEDNMRERENRDHVPFSQWVKTHHINATPGKVVDFKYIASTIERLTQSYDVKYICADPWKLEYLRQLLNAELQGRFIEISQSMNGMSGGMSELERLFMAGEISHEADPCGRWTFGNVAVATDGNENKKPMKNKSYDRIDPVCALIDATAAAVKLEPKQSVYEKRGLRVI